ncbi:phenylalanyl-tRNA synthetase beta subunit [Novosphingobium aromaticivorans DSM 12444]|uniref:Phenylalanine--tRNA ligase beta subunit n=1 Tax=Novosphingobium aromaticivorans (strain ATCC 700278 / DSM 12444 / CCUG 56034 / CIP 105152 / NBRC 16084 / F199) TaxID=279238 RepID=SYFB_NOVAD|nr:phenylalanine--tRNA ligase subunit beta [Novosphingobium aromaticivorans]Q2GAI7.1 RecName: Full=Phenylalanine--tRNA ligase beta subunit; AltName: Full=Phenylalanyl-tRNA synthetase beta subunit; Short=PheRS [Novosphingobium aromaticivorans DSM 12444]ABD25136.1 phenylalanyl-tRNA synthetase beta subunit [Novosphingobium aromaticivorans DSM 12444]SCX84627.1 phenylalanyl-tRNA synthetase beta subunit [Novosphingobium aromaticivorans]
MKFSFSWLKSVLDTKADAKLIAEKLTSLGLEIESVEDASAALKSFRVARVLTAEKHPQADKLQVLSVDLGDGNPLQVVCGAPNARAGLVGVLGLPGAVVPANGMELRKSAIRGVESNGMMCSTRELGLGEEHDGIIELPGDAPLGTTFADYLGSDPVFDVAITPNRPDCMGVYGIARDLAAAGLGVLKPIAAQSVAGSFPCPVEVRTDDPEGCPAFYGRVIRGVRNGPSPKWLQDYLKSAGQRPISALVDITNYVMLGYGRPAHAYDVAKLSGAVVARKAREGETCLALNGKEYGLQPWMTVIADDAGVHDIAGIMGGEHSGCSDETTDVLLEVAYFTPANIARTGQALALTSDARGRFERGVDPAFLDTGLDLLTSLILEICGGEASEVVRAGEPPLARKALAYDPDLAGNLGGIDVAAAEQKRILGALGFDVADDWTVAVPTWRPDVAGPPDIVEEVIRVHGLDAVPSTPLPRADGVAKPTATPAQMLERRVRRAAASRGLHEAVTWSFLPEAEAARFADGEALWSLANPISEDLKVMRPSLLPGLLSAAQRNLHRGATSIRLFEIGRRYLRGAGGASDEKLSLAVVLAGDRIARGWASGKAQPFDAFDAKAEALALLAEAGAPVDNLQVMGEAGPQFHPGQSATLRLGPKQVLARFGMLHPATARAFDLDGPVAVVELFLDRIPAKKGAGQFARPHYAPPALQAVTRDFAFLVDASVPAGDLLRAVKGADKQAIVAARVFDDFRGQGVAEGQKSLAIEVTLQPVDKSFDEAALKAIADKVVAAAGKLGAELRR